MSDDPAADARASRVIENAQTQIEASAREASRWDKKWDGYCGLVQACDEDEGWGEFLTELRREEEAGRGDEEEAFSAEVFSALRERLEALRCAAVASAVVPARSVGSGSIEDENDEEDERRRSQESAAASAASDAPYAAAVSRVRVGDMRGAAALLREAAFVEARPRARARISKYLAVVEARASSDVGGNKALCASSASTSSSKI